jgi:DNA-binding CsgD family transcriptional regulator
MLRPDSVDIARLTFDAVTNIRAEADVRSLEAIVGRLASAVGFTDVLIVDQDEAALNIVAGISQTPGMTEWLARPDPVRLGMMEAAAGLLMNAPFFWSDVATAPELATFRAPIQARLADLGLIDIFVGARRRARGTLSGAVMAGPALDGSAPDARAAAVILSDVFWLATRQHPAPSPAQALLTERQVQCLYWTRQGKSATDIASILGISAHTVSEHLARACERLGVRTRVQAVAAAMSRGLL